ncbi:protein of unknown function [Burkholderia multivorans]
MVVMFPSTVCRGISSLAGGKGCGRFAESIPSCLRRRHSRLDYPGNPTNEPAGEPHPKAAHVVASAMHLRRSDSGFKSANL